MPQGDVLDEQVAEQGCLAGPGLADDIYMVAVVGSRNAERMVFAPSFALSDHDMRFIVRFQDQPPLLRRWISSAGNRFGERAAEVMAAGLETGTGSRGLGAVGLLRRQFPFLLSGKNAYRFINALQLLVYDPADLASPVHMAFDALQKLNDPGPVPLSLTRHP